MNTLLKDLLTALKQLIGVSIPRQGKVRLASHALMKMNEYHLSAESVENAFRFGKEVKPGMLIQQFSRYVIGLTYKFDEVEQRNVVLTCWKRAKS